MIRRGIRLLEERKGFGLTAKSDDDLVYNIRIYLNRGEEVPVNDLKDPFHENFKKYHAEKVTVDEGYEFINFNTRLGRRDTIKGIEYSLDGMQEGGYRKVKISSHLAYKVKGIPGRVPPNAAIILEIWLRKIIKTEKHFDSAA